MKMLAVQARGEPITLRLTIDRATAEERIPTRRDSDTVGQSYCIGMGKPKASIPM
jgi:hypothetical protein